MTAPPEITIGARLRVVMLDKPGGKRTGQTRPVRVLAIVHHAKPLTSIRSVEVVTTDAEPRRAWVEPRYLLAAAEASGNAGPL